jgi:site-specific recombinase XerD
MPPKPKLLDQVRQTLRLKNYSYRTEQSYVGWIRRFILFHHKRHPREMGKTEVESFLTHLAVDRHVAASTQNQALSALIFLYTHVLNQPLGVVDVVWAKKPKRLPVVLTQKEVTAVLKRLQGVPCSSPNCFTAPDCACRRRSLCAYKMWISGKS